MVKSIGNNMGTNIKNNLGNRLTELVELNVTDPAKYIKYVGAGTNVFADICQTASFAFNKKIDDKTRKFMVLQELIKGVISTTLMLLTATLFETIGEKLVDRCVIMPNNIPKNMRKPEIIEKMLASKALTETQKKYVNSLTKCKAGVGAVTVILGEVVAFNIFTPILSNMIAAVLKKREKKDNLAKQNANNGNPVNNNNKTNNKSDTYDFSILRNPVSHMK